MKNLIPCITILFVCSGYQLNGQAAFGVSPGLGFNSAYLGIKVNDKVLPYISLQYAGAKYKYEEPDYTDEFSGSLIVPTLGLKLFLGGTNNIRSYLNIAVSKPIVSGELKYDDEVDEAFDDAISNISLIGAEAGFGVEYFFDDNFSVGGEYGIRYLGGKFEVNDEFDDYSVKANIKPTYSKIGFNFYFSRKTE
jgi:opacity protein-like surface antigen